MNYKDYFDFEGCFKQLISDHMEFLETYKNEDEMFNDDNIGFNRELYDFVTNDYYGAELDESEINVRDMYIFFEFNMTTNQNESDPIGDMSCYTVVYNTLNDEICDFYWKHN